MANALPSPLVLPDPSAVGSGQPLRASSIKHLLGAMNQAHADGHATHVFQQEWADSLCKWNSTIVEVCRWRIPVISDAHTSLQISLEASATVNAGTITFDSVAGADTQTVAVPVGAAAWVHLPDLTVDTSSSFEDVVMSLTAGAGGEVKVLRVVARYEVLPSPLANTVVNNFTPYGEDYFAADQPLPSYVGKTLVKGQTHLLGRRRSYACWSGLSNISIYSTNASAGLTLDPRISMHPISLGSKDRGERLKLWVYADSDATNDMFIFPLWGSGEVWEEGGAYVKIPAAAATAWYTVSFYVPELPMVAGMPYPFLRFNLDVREDVGKPSQKQLIRAYSLFGV